MVSKYRDILEPQREIGRSTSLSGRSIRHEINSPTSTGDYSSFLVFLVSSKKLHVASVENNVLVKRMRQLQE